MHNIEYNIRFRKEVPPELLEIFTSHGIITGSTILEDRSSLDTHDIDVAVFCSAPFICSFDKYMLAHFTNASTRDAIQGDVLSTKLQDAAQYVFNILLFEQYSLYIKGNYRDSTFLSCYVMNEGQLFNLLLMDEENVFLEWSFATSQLFKHRKDPELRIKYNRIKFFERNRKWFRGTLKIDKR